MSAWERYCEDQYMREPDDVPVDELDIWDRADEARDRAKDEGLDLP